MTSIAITNQKGGVGKTTTAVNLAACLADQGVRVLLIDLDPQANATSGLNIDPQPGTSLYLPLTSHGRANQMIQPTRLPNLSIIPSHMELAGCEIDLARENNHLTKLRDLLEPLKQTEIFDYIILDTPPSLGILMTSALAAADEIIIPLQCEYFGLEGLAKIVHIVEQIRNSGANPNAQIEGIIMTMYDPRTNLARQVVSDVTRHFEETVYNTIIPRTIRLGEAPSFGLSIIEHEPKGRGANAYRDLACEFLQRHQKAVSEQVAIA
jgi:chromosome partitioning protein